MIRVLVVDDHPVFRDGVSASLARVADFAVVGVAATGEEAVALVASARPDVVLMDLNLPGISGVEATRRVLAAVEPPPAVLAITMVDDDDTVLAALRAGAVGYILKGSTGEEIAAAARTVAAGGAVFGPGVAARILAASTGRRPVRDGDLTDRERDVLSMIAEGSSNAQIARALGLSLKTVQNYVSRVLDKLQVADRTQAAIRAREGLSRVKGLPT